MDCCLNSAIVSATCLVFQPVYGPVVGSLGALYTIPKVIGCACMTIEALVDYHRLPSIKDESRSLEHITKKLHLEQQTEDLCRAVYEVAKFILFTIPVIGIGYFFLQDFATIYPSKSSHLSAQVQKLQIAQSPSTPSGKTPVKITLNLTQNTPKSKEEWFQAINSSIHSTTVMTPESLVGQAEGVD